MGMTIIGQTQFGGRGTVVDPTFPVMPTAASLSITDIITRITGNTTVGTINPPNPYLNGPIYLINTDATVGAWDTSGNIALGGTFTRYKIFPFFFDPATQKWYPVNTA